MRSNIIILIRIALVLVFLIGIIICLFWYPFSITLSSGTPLLDYDKGSITQEQNVEFHVQLLFYLMLSLPCFAVVIMGFADTMYIKRAGLFNEKSAEILFKMSLTLFISSIVFIIGNIVFMNLNWNMFALLYYIIGGAGLAVSAGLYAAHKCTLKRIADSTPAH